MKNARDFKMPYSAALYFPQLLELVEALGLSIQDVKSTAEYMHRLTIELGKYCGMPGTYTKPNFHIYGNENEPIKARELAAHFYCCGMSTDQIRSIVSIPRERAYSTLRIVNRRGCSTHTRGKGNLPILDTIKPQRSIRFNLLMSLYIFAIKNTGADDLQAVVAATYMYFMICEEQKIKHVIDAAMLYIFSNSDVHSIKKCIGCASIFVRDDCGTVWNDSKCCFCKAEQRSGRFLDGKSLGIISSRPKLVASASHA